MRKAIALVGVALGALAPISPAVAGPEPGLCSMDTSRGQVPTSFALQACVSANAIIVRNQLQVPVRLAISGQSGATSRSRIDSSVAGILTRRHNGGDASSLFPNEVIRIPIGADAARVRIRSTEDGGYYALATTLDAFFPLGFVSLSTRTMGALNSLTTEIDDDLLQYRSCSTSPRRLQRLTCRPLLVRNIAVAVARANTTVGIAVIKATPAKIATLLLDTANWMKFINAQPAAVSAILGSTALDVTAAPVTGPSSEPSSEPTPEPPPVDNGQVPGSSPGDPGTPAPPGSAYAGHIVKWSGENPSPVSSWYVTQDLRRLWIPDGGTFQCLQAKGAPGPDMLVSATLNQLPDLTNRWAACGDNMTANRVLRRQMHIDSADGRYHLWLQGDGNMVLYNPAGKVLWANNRFNTDLLVMQGDGNLVGYTDAGQVTWTSSTAGSTGTKLVVQNDGNLVIYSAGKAVWSTNTVEAPATPPTPPPTPLSAYAGHVVKWSGETPSPVTSWYVTQDLKRLWIPDGGTFQCLKAKGAPGPDMLVSATLNQLPDLTNRWAACGDNMTANRVLRRQMHIDSSDGRYHLWLQGDGNTVLYGPTGRALWANNRFNTDLLVMQPDGNLVGYTDAGQVTWASNTAGASGTTLFVQSDGNLVMYSGGHAIWSTNTAGRT